MSFIYLVSIIYLIVSFLLYRKSNDKFSIVTSIIYTICLLFCYNTVVVSIYSFFRIDGSLALLSLINFGIGTLLNFVSIKRKKIQTYFFDRKELLITGLIILVVLGIGLFRFRGFTTISYESADSSLHYKHALSFSENLEILNDSNSKDIIYGNFDRVMPVYYINSGIILNICSNITSYWLFIYFDCFCLMLSSLLFFVTIFKFFERKKIFYSLVLTFIYLLGFPLNNLIFGFCYLGIGVMIINLSFFTIVRIKNFNDCVLFKLVLLFMINFSVFFSYYLFMPCVYLAEGVYYIYLWKKKSIDLKHLLLYGVITLVIPFIIGFVYFILPGFVNSNSVDIFYAVGLDGYIYSNKTPRYLFGLLLVIFIVRGFRKREKLNYFNLNLGIMSCYILLFFCLYLFEMVGLYYFYKLFYLYWFFAIIFIGSLLLKKKEYIYTFFVFIIIGMMVAYLSPNNIFSEFLVKSNIFSWNARCFDDNKIIFTGNELKLVKESVKYNDSCVIENQFLISGEKKKNPWIYSITNNIPLFDWKNGVSSHLGNDNIRFDFWESMDDYRCLIYFYEDKKQINYEDYNNLEVLYGNEEGVILRKKNKRS